MNTNISPQLLPFLLTLTLVTKLAGGSTYLPSDTCSTEHQVAVWQSVVGCQPRPTLVEVEFPDEAVVGSGSIVQLIPGHVMVDRCSGSCHSPAHSCTALRSVNVSVDVMAVQTTYSTGAWNTLCTTIDVRKDVECGCACLVRPEDCSGNQRYDESSCKCRCNDQAAKEQCHRSGRTWNANTCTCACPQHTWRACSTGFTFDYQFTCSCLRTFQMAGGTLALLAVVAVMMFSGMAGAVYFLRKRLHLQDRRADAHREFVDAFIQR